MTENNDRDPRERDSRDRDAGATDPHGDPLRDAINRDARDRDGTGRDAGGRDGTGRDPLGRDPIGTVADEARKLFDTIQGRATRQVGRTVLNSFAGGSFGGGRKEKDVWGEAVSEPHDEYICRACPVCRAIAAQRESGSDVTGHLVAAGGELFAAFRQTLDAFSKPASPRRSRDDSERGHDTVQHIDLG
ncbi:hypothetical protein ACIBG4_03650 [Nonomuraea sp. NPDC050383]|uniref:hypothetical protein n=1 Tax=Nonomuraea sp. NPDC050383 TaxID=3364362 RepID=UPI003799D0FA